MSTGYFAAIDWEGDSWKLTVGSDLRFIRQELNENIDQGGGTATGNSPVPRSHQSNPGLFTEFEKQVGLTRLRAGARLDWISSNVDDDPEKLMDIGIRDPDLPFRSSLADILGTNDFDRDEQLIAAHLTAERQLDVSTFFSVGVGYAERPPTLTELYAAQPFMFLLQSGLNTVTGDPTLESEKRWQFDVGLRHETEYVRSGINGFHAWVQDYITFENLGTFPSNRQPEQVRLSIYQHGSGHARWRRVLYRSRDDQQRDGVCTMSYLEGRDQDRNGDDATQRATTTQPLMTVPGESRGAFSGITGGEREALPGIHPVQSHVGIRLHDSAIQRDWSVELSARIVSGAGSGCRESAGNGDSGFHGLGSTQLPSYDRRMDDHAGRGKSHRSPISRVPGLPTAFRWWTGNVAAWHQLLCWIGTDLLKNRLSGELH